jgi:hypothetical protein
VQHSIQVVCVVHCAVQHSIQVVSAVPQGLHWLQQSNVKGQGEVHPRTGHEDPEGE